MVKRCINIDWLEVYALEDSSRYPCNADYFRSLGYTVVEREYGTRVYKEMFTIEDAKGNPFIEIRRNPSSDKSCDGGLFPAESCHLRLSNFACYADSPVDDLRRFMVQHCYSLVRIFRIDICLDFARFDRGDDPAKFVRRYIEGKYSKVNQSNLSAHGTDTWRERKFNSLSWGALKSMVSTKLYNKSIELEQSHDKPYIRYAWYLCGLISNPIDGTLKQADGSIVKPDIWRVEFSIKSSAKKWYVMENTNLHKKTNEYVPHTLDCYDNRGRLITAFANLARCYFHFKVYQPDVRKDRCQDKVLFEFTPSDEIYRIAGNVNSRPATPFNLRLVRYLSTYRENTPNEHTKKIATELINIVKSEQVSQFAGNGLDEETILTLQRLISEHVGSLNDADREETRKEIKTLVHDFFKDAF